MWFPQVHVSRFAQDLALTEQYGCQGILGIHWRHRIIDPVAGYLSRRCWDSDLKPASHYKAYARTHASGERIDALADLLNEVDENRRLMSTWTGEMRPDGHARHQEWAGDYNEAFTIEKANVVPETTLASQVEVIQKLSKLLEGSESPLERERLGYWHGQVGFLDPYGRAYKVGADLHKLILEQHERKQRGEIAGATASILEHAVSLWIELLGYVREAVLCFQHTIATRNDLGMLVSIHNKFVRIATFR